MRQWWVTKYNRPTSDPLFINQSESELLLEMYEDLYARKEDLEYKMSKNELDEGRVAETLARVQEALGETSDLIQDELADEWEADFMAGRMPDLDKM